MLAFFDGALIADDSGTHDVGSDYECSPDDGLPDNNCRRHHHCRARARHGASRLARDQGPS